MKRWINLTIAALAMTASSTLLAQNDSDIDPNARTVRPSADAAQVTGVMGRPGHELFGVRFVELNGRNIPARDSMWLAPGSYILTVVIDAAHVRRPPASLRSRPRNRIAEDDRLGEVQRPTLSGERLRDNQIRVELEAGKTYEIRARYNDDDRDSPYTLVVHRIIER